MIATILVNWNGHKDTIECLESLLRQNTGDFAVVIVDNGSTDGSIEAIEAWAHTERAVHPEGPPWPRLPNDRKHGLNLTKIQKADIDQTGLQAGQIVIIEAGENLGFAGANNLGMRLAAANSAASYIWLLNNDTVVAPDCADHLVSTARAKPWAKIIGSRLCYYHDPDVVQGVAGRYNHLNAKGAFFGFLKTSQTLEPIDAIEKGMNYVMGASMFLPVSAYREIGPMAEDYFLYFEELDWSQRLRGKRHLTTALEAVVYHKEGGSIGTDSLDRASDTSLYYLNRGLLKYYWKWHKPLLPVAYARIFYRIRDYKKTDLSAVKVLRLALHDFHHGVKRTGRVVV